MRPPKGEIMLKEAIEFFAAHAGFGYDPTVETEEEGKVRCARNLAEAEEWARGRLHFEWSDDWSIGDHVKEFDCYDDGGPSTCETCIARDRMGDVVGSLGCIDDATDEYRRVVEAEIADGYRSEILSAI